MIDQALIFYKQLLLDLEFMDENHEPDLYAPDKRLEVIGELMCWFKERLPVYNFENDEQEIRFYKWIFPPFLSLHIYYTEKSALELNQLIGTKKSIREYSTRVLKRIDEFSEQNSGFYDYCSQRKTAFDPHYFLRSSPVNQEGFLLFGTPVDPVFYPVYSMKLAMMSAYRRLEADLLEADDKSKQIPGVQVFESKLKWTGTTVALTELMYSLSKYINHGNVHMKDIAGAFQHTFNVDLGNYSRTFQEIMRRKKGENQFLLQLANDFTKWIEERENARLKKNNGI